MKVLATLLFLLILTAPTRAQIGMGSGTPHPSAALELQATDKAFYPPKLTTIQRKAIVNPQPGAFVYDLDKGTFFLYDGVNWLPMVFNAASSTPLIDRTASDGAVGDNFGSSVAISGDYAVVGSPYASFNGNARQGVAYVFVRTGNTWRQDIKLANWSGGAGDQFGYSVAISGNNIIVGSPWDDVGGNIRQGSAFVFVRSGGGVWVQTQILASDGAAEDWFGWDVSISGNYALVGSIYGDYTFPNQGSAYIFALSGSSWIQQAELFASDGGVNEQFGYSVAISGNYALVSCHQDNIGSNGQQGSAYVFVRSGSTWAQQAKLTASDGAANHQFGYNVDLSGDYAIIGNFFENTTGAPPGAGVGVAAAYIFVRIGGGWTQQARLPAVSSSLSKGGYFRTVGISGNYALVGWPQDDIGGNIGQGSVYLYERKGTSWSELRMITDNSPENTNNGYGVGISNGTFIIGGPGFQKSKGKVGFGTVDN